MQYLRQSTSVTVVIGPVWATADGALKADLAYDASGINCDIYKNGTKADITLANSAGDGYFRAASGEALYLLTLSTGHTDTIGRALISLSATGYYCKPVEFVVLDEAVYDVLFGTTAPSTLAAGALMGLVDDAITAGKFDESTAYPLKSADTGATAVARTGADSDTLEVLSDEIAGLATTLGAAGAGLTALPWNAAWDAEVQSECADALTAYDPPTKTELDNGFAALADDADIAAAVRDVTLTGAVAGSIGAAIADILTDTGTTLDTLVKDIPTNAELATALGDLPTAAENADAVWDEVVTTGVHDTATFAGAGLLAAAAGGDPWSTALPGAYGAGTAGLLLGTTIPTAIADVPTVSEFEARTLASASYFDPAADTVAHVTLVDTTTTNTDMVAAAPAASAIADAVLDEAMSGHTTAGTLGKAVADTLADTNELQTNQGNWATATGFSTHSADDVATALGTGAGLTTLATQASVNDLPTNAELAVALAAADDAVLAAIAALNDISTVEAQAAAAAALAAYGASTYAGGDTAGTTTLLSRIVGTLLAGNHTAQSGDAYARLGAPAGASVSADIADLPTNAELEARTLAAASYFDPSTDEVDVGKVKGVAVTDIDDFRADVSGLSTLGTDDLPSEPPSAATIATAVWSAVSRTLTAFGFEVTATVDEEALAAAVVAAIEAEGIEATVDETAIALAITTALGSLSVTVASAVGSGGTVTVHAGDDYLDAEGRAIAFTIADATHTYLLDDGTAVVKLKSGQATWTATSITSTAGGYIVLFEPDAEDTAALTYKQAYEVEATLTSGSVVTLKTGDLVVVRDIPAGT